MNLIFKLSFLLVTVFSLDGSGSSSVCITDTGTCAGTTTSTEVTSELRLPCNLDEQIKVATGFDLIQDGKSETNAAPKTIPKSTEAEK